MPVTVKQITLWRTEAENRAGVLAQTLKPLAEAGADLHLVMGYRYPGDESKAAIEVYPIAGKKVTAAARASGLSGSATPTLLVEGDNKPGLGHSVAQAIADAGINLSFLVAQVLGKRYSAVLGFETGADAKAAAALIRKATAVLPLPLGSGPKPSGLELGFTICVSGVDSAPKRSQA